MERPKTEKSQLDILMAVTNALRQYRPSTEGQARLFIDNDVASLLTHVSRLSETSQRLKVAEKDLQAIQSNLNAIVAQPVKDFLVVY
jgi:hypothetical protein